MSNPSSPLVRPNQERRGRECPHAGRLRHLPTLGPGDGSGRALPQGDGDVQCGWELGQPQGHRTGSAPPSTAAACASCCPGARGARWEEASFQTPGSAERSPCLIPRPPGRCLWSLSCQHRPQVLGFPTAPAVTTLLVGTPPKQDLFQRRQHGVQDGQPGPWRRSLSRERRAAVGQGPGCLHPAVARTPCSSGWGRARPRHRPRVGARLLPLTWNRTEEQPGPGLAESLLQARRRGKHTGSGRGRAQAPCRTEATYSV